MATPFATPADVVARWRPLTPNELGIVSALLSDASAVVRARFPGIDAQVESGALDSDILVMVVANMVKRAMIAPDTGVTQESEAAGPFSRSASYANPMQAVFLTAAELVAILGYQSSGVSVGYSNTTMQIATCQTDQW